MRKFREFISEEILPFAQTEKGFVGIDNGPVRDNINLLLANVTAMPYSTPYHAMEAVRRVLMSFHIALPATNFMSGDAGHEAFPINQFGKKMGVLPTGDVVTQMPSAYYVYFEYEMNDRGSFEVFCEVVDEEELNEILNDVEEEEAEIERDAEDSYDAYKASNMSEQIVYRGENKDSAKRRKIMSVLHDKKTNKLLPGMHEDYDSNEAEMANRAKEFFNSPSKVIQSNARKIHKSHNDKAVTGMKEEKLDEVSQKAATSAYASANDPSYGHPKADKILGHIKRKFGSKAASGAEDHAYASHFGRGTPRKGKDSLSGGLRQYASDKVTKSGKIPKGTQTAMKNRMDSSKWQGHGRKVGGPKGQLPEEAINEISKQLAHKASEKAYEKGSDYYDSTTKLRRKAFKSKDKGDMDAATAEQGKMSKKWKQSMKFKAYADKKMEEETINEISAGKANDAYHAAADKGKTADVMAGATGSKKWRKKANKKWDQARKFADYADKKSMKEDAPFDNPTSTPSTPYKNPASKAKQLARQAMKMKKAEKNDKAFAKLSPKDQTEVNRRLRMQK